MNFLKEFVQEYNPKGIILDDETYDRVEVPLTFYTFFYNCYRKLRAWAPVYNFRMWLQKIFRTNHLSDNDIWGADYHLAKYILKVLRAYKKYDRHGYPGIFSEYSENEWRTKEEYDEAIASGRMKGGGPEAWEKILDRMIATFEGIVYCDFTSEKEAWYVKHFGFSPHAKLDVNHHWRWEYKYKKDNDNPRIGCMIHFGHTPPEGNPEDFETFKKEVMYSNTELDAYIAEWTAEGLHLFAEHFHGLWD